MPESRFIEARRLKPLVGYLVVAFVVMLVVGTQVPRGTARTALLAAWLVLFPLGAWKVVRRRRE